MTTDDVAQSALSVDAMLWTVLDALWLAGAQRHPAYQFERRRALSHCLMMVSESFNLVVGSVLRPPPLH